MKKNLVWILVVVASVVIGGVGSYFCFGNTNSKEEPLPKQEKSEGLRGVYDIDKNINEKTIDNYLGRSDFL